MRKLIFQAITSVDGFFEGPNKEIDWHNVDEEFNNYAIDFLNELDLLLFGRVTYELMVSYWPKPDAIKNDPIVASKMNGLSKVVFSTTMQKADWNNTLLIKENIAEEVKILKHQPGKDIAILGSSDLAVSLIEHDLVDEFRICIDPLVLGNGKPLFQGMNRRFELTLIKTREFRSGNVLLYYKPGDK